MFQNGLRNPLKGGLCDGFRLFIFSDGNVFDLCIGKLNLNFNGAVMAVRLFRVKAGRKVKLFFALIPCLFPGCGRFLFP